MSETETEEEWCPTRAGTTHGYIAQFQRGGEWKRIETSRTDNGVPYPILNGGIFETIDMFGKAQANSLAYTFKALAESRGEYLEVRIQKYLVVYDIKAKEEPETD